MKETFAQVEARLRSIVEDNAAKLFGLPGAERKLAAQLTEAMQREIRAGQDERFIAPDIYGLHVHPRYAEDVRASQGMLEELAETLLNAGREAGLIFPSMPIISVVPDETLKEGEFAMRAMHSQSELEETQTLEIETGTPPGAHLPTKAFLIVAGSKIFPLDIELVNIGRMLDNELVIDDPRVSRRHAQMRAANGTYYIFDLESSGGTFVNGARITQTTLIPGDVISLGGVALVYGQEGAANVVETQEYAPPKEADDSATQLPK